MPNLCSRDDIGGSSFQWQKENLRQRSHDEELNTSLQQVDIRVTRLTQSIVECRQQCEEQRVTCRWTYLLTESLSLHLFTVQQVLRRPELGGQ